MLAWLAVFNFEERQRVIQSFSHFISFSPAQLKEHGWISKKIFDKPRQVSDMFDSVAFEIFIESVHYYLSVQYSRLQFSNHHFHACS